MRTTNPASTTDPRGRGGWGLGFRVQGLHSLARVLPIGPGGPQSGFSTPEVCITGLSQKKIGSADSPPPPPGAPPGPGFLSVERGVSHQLAGAVVLGGGAAPGPPLAARAAGAPALLQFEWLSKTRGTQALGAWPRRPGRDG
jgi:hypothetical protein